jgi:hypothetical protein
MKIFYVDLTSGDFAPLQIIAGLSLSGKDEIFYVDLDD